MNERNTVILTTDMRCALPCAAFRDKEATVFSPLSKRPAGGWRIIEYDSNLYRDLFLQSQDPKAAALTIPLDRTGWHAVSIGLAAAGRQLRAFSEPAQRLGRPDVRPADARGALGKPQFCGRLRALDDLLCQCNGAAGRGAGQPVRTARDDYNAWLMMDWQVPWAMNSAEAQRRYGLRLDARDYGNDINRGVGLHILAQDPACRDGMEYRAKTTADERSNT